ncbi:MAG: PLD nuclease N-terminal domain-containing protein [Capsulimonadaceae bacterium]
MHTIFALAGGLLLFLVILVIVTSVFWIIELIDICTRQFPDPTLKIVWLLVVFFLHFLGALVYHFVGRQMGTKGYVSGGGGTLPPAY